MARVVLARSARASLLAFDDVLSDAVLEALKGLEMDPTLGYELKGRLKGLRSLRIGSYRIIYELRERDRLVRVCAIKHRGEAHRQHSRSGWMSKQRQSAGRNPRERLRSGGTVFVAAEDDRE